MSTVTIVSTVATVRTAAAVAGRWLTRVGAMVAVAGTAHAAWNSRLLRVPPTDPPPVAVTCPVAVLLPLRDEAHRVEPCLTALLAQTGLGDLRVLILDDESTDGTADLVRRVAADDPRVRLVAGAALPPGWWGKPWACAQLAAAAGDATVLVFVDADVVLAPHAVAASVSLLRTSGLDLVSPYPRQIAESVAERLVQPLLQWSWLTTLPLRVAEHSPRESLAAANGQLIVVDAAAYRRAGGHETVRQEMLEDVALLRAVKRSGGRGGVVDGTAIAACRMYAGWADLEAGYRKSLWSAFGSPTGAAAVVGVLCITYVLPPLAVLRGSRVGLFGYAAGVAGRVVAARRTGSRVWPDALAHPVSVALFGWLVAGSVRGHRAGTLTVRGRRLPGRDSVRESRTT